jgi:integrase/recombinase XerD
VTIGGYSNSTLFNYSRAVAKVSLHFKKSILDLDPDEVNEFLSVLAKEMGASSAYFKHVVYGLRFFFHWYEKEDHLIKMPSIKEYRKRPNVL